MIPYAKQSIDEEDIQAVVETLRSAWLTTGPKVREFEEAFAAYTGAKYAVAVNSGTAALHAAMHAHGVGPGDEVIVPANTFAASANAVLYSGARPVFADIEPDTFLVNASDVAAKITPKTKGIVSVDFAGQPCDYGALQSLADRHGLFLHADACHALGAEFGGTRVGNLAETNSFSFHPVKPITTAEGGMVTTNSRKKAEAMRIFRNHGIETDARQREAAQTWEYDMKMLGWNYRLSDLQCALGLSQLRKNSLFLSRRVEVARFYDSALESLPHLQIPVTRSGRSHAFHLYPLLLSPESPVCQRAAFQKLRANGIGAHVMYRPVYLHSYYAGNLGYSAGACPAAEQIYERILTLPVSAVMTPEDCEKVVAGVRLLFDSPS